MYCKSVRSTKIWTGIIFIGIITLIFSVLCYRNATGFSSNFSMLMGMFSGLGGAFTAIGIIKFIHYKRTPAAKLKQEEIELKDERNVEILRLAYTVSNSASSVLFAVMAFVFVWLDYKVPAFICIGALYVQIVVFLIACRHFSRKM